MEVTDNEKKKLKILIVDDSEYERDLFARFLEKNYEIIEAENGRDAIVHITMNRGDIALILLDLVMPEMDGFEVLEIMNQMGWNEDIPVIVISSENSTSLVQKCYDLGVTDYIAKDVKRAIINKRVENTIRLFAKQRILLELMNKENQRIQTIDPLTNILNMNGFRSLAKETLQKNPGIRYALTYVDIKGFKFVNDLFGIENGNQLLKEWARLISESLKENELVARIDADKFVCLSLMEQYGKADERFMQIRENLEHYLDRPGRSYLIEFAAGTYIVLEKDYQNIDVDIMLSHAIVAHENARRHHGSSHEFFNQEEWMKQWRSQQISQHLDDAISNGEISVWLQPQYSYTRDRIVSAEALCRWVHPDLDFLSPGEFIPVLEKTSQIYTLDCFVWEKVCSLLRKWKDSALVSDFSVSVNISRADLRAKVTPDMVLERLIRKYNLEPSDIHVEITESAYVEDSALIINLVNSFHEKGFIVEMDDFGSGYSSLNSLKDIDVDVLKLDMGFLHNAEENQKGGKILDGIIKMAKTLEIELVAEGIETIRQAEFLGDLGCDIMQGFYFSRPLPVDQFENLIQEMKTETGRKKLHSESDSSENFKELPRVLHQGFAQREKDMSILKQILDHQTNSLDLQRHINALPAGLFSYSPEGDQNFEYISEGLLWLLGYPDELTFRGKFSNSFKNLIYEQDRERVLEEIDRQITSTSRYDYCEYRIETADGSLKWVYDCGHLIHDENGKPWFYVVIADMDQIKNQKTIESNNSERYKVLSKIRGFNVFEYYVKSDTLNSEVTRDNGFHFSSTVENFIERMDMDGLVDSQTSDDLRNILAEVVSGEVSDGSFKAYIRLKGDFFHSYRVYFNSLVGFDGKVEKIIGYASNIDKEESAIVRWRERANRDSMTCLLNHDAAIRAIDSKMADGQWGALLLVDIDNFKSINDKYGHLEGDGVITNVGHILHNLVRTNDVLGRFGGDEFIVYLTDMIDMDVLNRKLSSVMNALNDIKYGDDQKVSISIGVKVCSDHNKTADECIKSADSALYKSKQQGKNRFSFY